MSDSESAVPPASERVGFADLYTRYVIGAGFVPVRPNPAPITDSIFTLYAFESLLNVCS